MTLPSGEAVSYSELRGAGLQEFYIRIVHQSALRGKVTRSQVDDWLGRAASRDRHTARAVRAELEALQPTPVAAPSPPAEPVRKRQQREKTFTLVSSGDHKQAIRTAERYGLRPTPVPTAALRPGQSPDAHTVRAQSGVASKLITTGQWKTE
ncbi:MAG: hypothetical protein AVDCRST_MAG93-757 [uncultured Chloroflexia bacterium]|uniref:Uncharacterized protein n=1 Tax=uncultured Chloroflexia bacterium TaxID=1672391 RepID=A0A6J4HP43_9CHLR|nr:MAG: hypothetical protein AVDCRST_MAG93-757 [uncultured Chloroflexia bacterium]